MCFFVTDRTIKTAKKDLIMYKSFYSGWAKTLPKTFKGYENNLVSPYYTKRYKVGELYTDDESELSRGTQVMNDLINRAFHSYTTFEKALRNDSAEVICKVIIPKGSRYLLNKKSKELVSDKIIIKEAIWVINSLNDPEGYIYGSEGYDDDDEKYLEIKKVNPELFEKRPQFE